MRLARGSDRRLAPRLPFREGSPPLARHITARTGIAAVIAIGALVGTVVLAQAVLPGVASPLAAAPTASSGAAAVLYPGASPGLPTPAPLPSNPWQVRFAWHVPVLMYHLIATPLEAGDAQPGLVVAPTLFAAQMATARAAGWRTITAAELALAMAAGREPPPRTFVITIDDGHEDGWSEAFPILQQDGFVATYFVPTERIGHPGYLTPDQITAMAAAGMEIADHTVNHLPLARLSTAVARYQLEASASYLARLLGAPPLTLAYPYGSHDLAVEADASQAGFLVAFTTVEGCSETVAGRMAEPRVRVRSLETAQSLLDALDRCASLPVTSPIPGLD